MRCDMRNCYPRCASSATRVIVLIAEWFARVGVAPHAGWKILMMSRGDQKNKNIYLGWDFSKPRCKVCAGLEWNPVHTYSPPIGWHEYEPEETYADQEHGRGTD